jgi:DNA-binding NarL/FixJ family response regulator
MNTDSLTPAQLVVFYLLVQGKSNAEIGQATHTVEKTIKGHVTVILKELKCKSRAQLIARYYLSKYKEKL